MGFFAAYAHVATRQDRQSLKPWHAAAIGADGRAALAAFPAPGGRVFVIASRALSAGHYYAAVELAIYGMFCHRESGATAIGVLRA